MAESKTGTRTTRSWRNATTPEHVVTWCLIDFVVANRQDRDEITTAIVASTSHQFVSSLSASLYHSHLTYITGCERQLIQLPRSTPRISSCLAVLTLFCDPNSVEKNPDVVDRLLPNFPLSVFLKPDFFRQPPIHTFMVTFSTALSAHSHGCDRYVFVSCQG